MKHTNTLLIQLFITLFLIQFTFAQKLFLKTKPSDNFLHEMQLNFPRVDMQNIKVNTLFLELNESLRTDLYYDNEELIIVNLPFFNGKVLELSLLRFSVVESELLVTRHTNNGLISEYYSPKIKTYRVENLENGISGVFILSEEYVKAIIRYNEEIYVLDKFTDFNTNYFISSIKHSPVDFEFLCANDHINQPFNHNHGHRVSGEEGLKCIDLAIEIDYYTFQTFQDYQLAVDWSIEMISVVSEIYLEELEVGIKSSSAQVWETIDPYANFIEDPQNMLFSIRQNWSNSFQLSSIDRNLVHLFSKRNNTGTGGIAFLNGLGSNWNGYGFSSNLTDDNDYVNLPVPYFFWNIYCLAHELGHNLGAKHTQWCGWPGGPIDNCASIEEMFPGECSDYNNNPSSQIGTIMSYCHTWSYASGGGILMKFNDLIKSTILTYLNSQNLGSCTEEVFGCMDSNACNYDNDANVHDNSCIYPELGFDCYGNCINDANQDGICNNENLFIEEQDKVLINIYPNPATDFIEIKMDESSFKSTYLEIFNVIGDLVYTHKITDTSSRLDISILQQGLYDLHFVSSDGIVEHKIIVQ
tara:strand:+ start:539 stop:2287 length:1749 start_codon:yes stop_codon:yes gene_type:complete